MKSLRCFVGMHDWRLVDKTTGTAELFSFCKSYGRSYVLAELVKCKRCGKQEGWITSEVGLKKISAKYLKSLMY